MVAKTIVYSEKTDCLSGICLFSYSCTFGAAIEYRRCLIETAILILTIIPHIFPHTPHTYPHP